MRFRLPSANDPATLMRPDPDRILAFAERLREAGDEDLARVVRLVATHLGRAPKTTRPTA